LKPKEFITRLKLLDEKIDQFYLPKLKTIKEKTIKEKTIKEKTIKEKTKSIMIIVVVTNII
uniref:hypothetical protein n=1 Tax=Acinetobacter venetianus TaxID=52133 RepID=UPI0004983EBC